MKSAADWIRTREASSERELEAIRRRVIRKARPSLREAISLVLGGRRLAWLALAAAWIGLAAARLLLVPGESETPRPREDMLAASLKPASDDPISPLDPRS